MSIKELKTQLPDAEWLCVAPGRINLLGEHVDYNGGAVLPAAIHRSIKLAALLHTGNIIELHAIDLAESVCFNLDQLALKLDINGLPLPGWACFPAGVAHVLQSHGYRITPIKAALTSDIPIGSGLSSSAALEVAFAALWQELGEWSLDRLSLARFCQEAENVYIGVNSGLMDQFASANGVEGHALYFNTKSLEYYPVPIPKNYSVVVADSKIRRKLTQSGYNNRRADCEEALAILKKEMQEIENLSDVSPAEFTLLAHKLPPVIARRARHVVSECARVERGVGLLGDGKIIEFGELMFDSHRSLRDDYEVSLPELNFLVETAASLAGCVGARLTGAGFGGCTVNIVENSRLDEFISRLEYEYASAFGKMADVFDCHIVKGVSAFPWNWNSSRLEKNNPEWDILD